MPIRKKIRVIDNVATGRAYRMARRSKGLSIEETARRMSVTGAFISYLERGKRAWTDDLCERFQKALKK